MSGVLGGIGTDRRAASATVGVVLIIGVTLIGTVAVVTLGSAAIGDTQQTADTQRGEHAMTQFASKVSMAALGESGSQSVSFGNGDGTVSVNGDAGRMQVWHLNATGEGTADRLLANETLGEVTYTNGDRTVAYQGGGVWRTSGDRSQMVSPPEFHYRDATLTLPIVSVTTDGGGAVAGTSHARIRGGETNRVFPDPGEPDRRNPVQNGTVVVVVESEYHDAWEQYFDRRTTGAVRDPDEMPPAITDDVDPDRSVILELEATGDGGSYAWPGRGGSIPVRGLADGHSLDDFSTVLDVQNPNNAWVSFHARDGDQKFEAVLQFDSGQGANTEICDATFDTRVLYTDGDVTHHWLLEDAYGNDDDNEFTDCTADELLEIDFTSSEAFTYRATEPDGDTEYDWDTADSDATIVDSDGNTVTRSHDETLEVEEFVGYYVWQMGSSFDLSVEYATGGNGQGNQLDPSTSSVTFEYQGGGDGRYITYLHVTENRVVVDVS